MIAPLGTKEAPDSGRSVENPVDLVRYPRDRQVIADDRGGWVLAQALPDVERELPQSVRSMIQRKIDQL
ncbi:MAG TPA: hypothetical protein VI756_25095 [Blastocatellia bacterium]